LNIVFTLASKHYRYKNYFFTNCYNFITNRLVIS